MEKLEKFIMENNCEVSQFKPNSKLISEVEKKLMVEFGPQLKKYLLLLHRSQHTIAQHK